MPLKVLQNWMWKCWKFNWRLDQWLQDFFGPSEHSRLLLHICLPLSDLHVPLYYCVRYIIEYSEKDFPRGGN